MERGTAISGGTSTQRQDADVGSCVGDHDNDLYWRRTQALYSRYPTVRHRHRFILGQLRRHQLRDDAFVFDYGCGEGTLLGQIGARLGLSPENLGGCDVSMEAVRITARRIASPHIFDRPFPALDRPFETPTPIDDTRPCGLEELLTEVAHDHVELSERQTLRNPPPHDATAEDTFALDFLK